MSSERSGARYLLARDQRDEFLSRSCAEGDSATVFLSLNLPGKDKLSGGIDDLFAWALSALHRAFPALRNLRVHRDCLGPCAAMQVDGEPGEVKRRCVRIETAEPFARLVDLDVYDAAGRQVDRPRLGLPARRCLICFEAAADCMRLGRHGTQELGKIVHELLAPLRNQASR
jgi:holo-ACP synthase